MRPGSRALEKTGSACDHGRMIRIPALEGACNFRDFGGYATRDGRRLRVGRFFRSGAMHRFTEGDRRAVSACGVRLVCDLRRPDERERQPNPDFGPGAQLLAWSDTQDVGLARSLPDPGSMTHPLARQVMIRHYAGMPTRLAPHVGGFFAALARRADGPLVVHCTAGKDRTGFVVALLLSALGVPRETVFEDYLLTNRTVDLRARLRDDETGLGIPQGRRYMVEMPDEALDAVLAADADYLRAAFDALEARHGSVEGYLQDVHDVDAAALAALAAAMLEPAEATRD